MVTQQGDAEEGGEPRQRRSGVSLPTSSKMMPHFGSSDPLPAGNVSVRINHVAGGGGAKVFLTSHTGSPRSRGYPQDVPLDLDE